MKKFFYFLGPDENRFSFDQSFNDGLDKVADFLNPDDKDADVLLNGWIDQLQDSFTDLANNEHVIEFSNNIKSKFQDDGEFKEIIGDFGDQFQEGMYIFWSKKYFSILKKIWSLKSLFYHFTGIAKFVEQMENEDSDAFDQWKNKFADNADQKEELNEFEEQLTEAWQQQNSENGSECILKSAKLSVILSAFFLFLF